MSSNSFASHSGLAIWAIFDDLLFVSDNLVRSRTRNRSLECCPHSGFVGESLRLHFGVERAHRQVRLSGHLVELPLLVFSYGVSVKHQDYVS